MSSSSNYHCKKSHLIKLPPINLVVLISSSNHEKTCRHHHHHQMFLLLLMTYNGIIHIIVIAIDFFK